MGIVLYGLAAVSLMRDPEIGRDFVDERDIVSIRYRPAGTGPSEVETELPTAAIEGIQLDESAGPFRFCESCIDSVVRFDWRQKWQLCDACGGPAITHRDDCPAAIAATRECHCGAR